jgi:tripartite-type tricarboxylate transporter receptor subunit TctC
VVGFPPGTQIDTAARLLGQEISSALGKPVVIDNVTGVSGNIATERVAKAAPDGYTLGFLGHGQLIINPGMYKVAFNPVKDFAPISQAYASTILLVVGNGVPAKSIKELIALAKARPGELTYASFGNGSPPHLAAELFKSAAGLDIRHIPYKGAALPDLLGGRVTMMFSPIGTVLPLVREGKLRGLAVTSTKRFDAAADLPTIAESGYPGFEVTIWSGLVAPAGTSPAIIDTLHRETTKALAQPGLRAKLADLGVEAIGSSPDQFARVIKSEIPKWTKVIKDSGIKPD